MAKQQAQPSTDVVYLVNPAGAIHTVTREHARGRLHQLGYRAATKDEIERYKTQKVQRAKAPIAPAWTPEPPPEPELPEAA
jgi:hypothetical protein